MKSPVITRKSYRTLALLLAVCLAASVFSVGATAASAPPVPANFKAASASYNTVKLTWSAAAGASGYVLYRYSAAAKTYARLAVVKTTAFINTGLVTGTRYYYKVRAYQTVSGKNIYSSPSAAVSAVPVPSVPVSFKAASASYNTLSLTWSAVAGASGYVLYRYDAVAKTYARLAVVTAPGYNDKQLTTGASYSYKVRAYRTVSGKNIYGNPGAAASAVPVPGMPADFKAAAGTYNNIKLTWSAVEGASGYVLYRLNAVSGAFERLAAVNTFAYADEGLAGAGPQSYKVIAYRTVSTKNVYGRVSAAVQATPGGISGPVGGSVADIVDFYNHSANATKAFGGKVTIERSSHMSPKLIFVPPELRTLIMLFAPEQFKEIQALEDELKAIADAPYEKTVISFVNGVGGYTTLTEFLPPSGSATMSTLAPEGAASAACVRYGGGWKITIKLVKESGNSSSYIPPYHSSCLNAPDFSGIGDAEGADTSIIYSGATLTAVVNAAGKLDKLDTVNPVTVMFSALEAGQEPQGIGMETVSDDNFIFTY